MRNTKLVPVNTALEVVPAKRRKKIDIRLWDIPLRMLGIFLAGAVPVSGLAPFGLSFLTIDRKFSLKSVLNLLLVCAGYILMLDLYRAAACVSACVLFETTLFVLKRNDNLSVYFIGAAAGISMFLCETAMLFLVGFTVAGLILIFCDVMLMLVGVLVFDRCRGVLLNSGFTSRGLLLDEKICLCVVAGIVLLSTRYLNVFNIFNLSNFLACLFLGIIALTGKNITRCAVSGIFAGIILGLSGGFPDYTAMFALCGLALGVAARFGKKIICLALCLFGGAALLYLGIPVGYEHLPNIYEIISAAVLIYLTPRRVIMSAERIIDFDMRKEDETRRFREYVKEKLSCISESFMDISSTFDEISDGPDNTDMTEIALMFDTAADRICKNCERAGVCWEKDFSSTYAAMFKFLEIMERKGGLQRGDVPKSFSDKCVHLLPLISEINRLFEIYKINTTWKHKLQESRELNSQQFKGISEIIKNASDEICGESVFDIDAADELKLKLSDMDVDAERVDVVCGKNQKYTVEIWVTGCADFSACRSKIKSAIKQVLGISVSTPYNLCENKKENKCKIRFCQLEGFEPLVGIASLGAGAECGDRHFTDYLSGGKLAVTISDGMGTGHGAALESGAIVSLLSSFLDAGFDKKIAVKLVNSIMVMKSARDVFATIDMCIIDLYTGQIEFIKNGAEPSYIKHPSYTETVRAASLPIGIVPIGDIEAFARTLENGSIVVMTSDGVTSPPDNPWIKEMVEHIDIEMSPGELAQLILDEAMRRGKDNNTQNDDMTVVCVKLEPSAAA